MTFLIECIDMVKFQEEVRIVWSRYNKIKKVYAPSLKSDVYFTRKGFRHLLGHEKHQSVRDRSEVKERFVLIDAAVAILRSARLPKSRKRDLLTHLHLEGYYEDHLILVIIYKDNAGMYKFLSVFEVK